MGKKVKIKNAERTFKINAQAYLEEALRNYEIDYGRLPKFLSEVDSNIFTDIHGCPVAHDFLDEDLAGVFI